MDWLRQTWFRFRALFRRRTLEAEMTEELHRHLEMESAANVARGLTQDEAHFAAEKQFGGVELTKEKARDERTWTWLEDVVRDLRLGFRALRRSPALSGAVIATLALCICANTTILSALYSLVLKPLPFPKPEELVEIYNAYPKSGLPKNSAGIGQYLDYKRNADLFAGVTIGSVWPFTIGEETNPERERGEVVTPDFFQVFGVVPLHGRFFTDEENKPGANRVLVLTESFWKQYYNGDLGVVGKTVRISGQPFEIIGIAPSSVESIDFQIMAFAPYANPPQVDPQSRFLWTVQTMWARLKPGVSLAAGLSQLDGIERRFYSEVANPATREHIEKTGQKIALGQVRAEQARNIKEGLVLLQGGVAFVLLIGCVNVANLLLARANARRLELAIRQALGATWLSLARQVVTEMAILAGLGALAGIGLAALGLRAINLHISNIIREAAPIRIDGTVFWLTVAITVGITLVASILPIASLFREFARRTSLTPKLQLSARGASVNAKTRALGGVLITSQFALALILLIGAALLIKSFANVLALNPGLPIERFVTGRVLLPTAYQTADTANVLQDRLQDALRAIPGVEAIGLTSNVVLQPRANPPSPIFVGSTAAGGQTSQPMGYVFAVSPGFFSSVGISVLDGREFEPPDRNPGPSFPIIVDRRFAEKFYPGRSPIGERLGLGSPLRPSGGPTIIGVAENVRMTGPDDQSDLPVIYMPLSRAANYTLLVRTKRSASDILPDIRAKLRAVDSTIPFYLAGSLQDQFDNQLVNRRGIVVLLVAFAGLALLLAAVGIYGVLAYDVTQRTREIGIRGALGATRGQIVAMVVGQGAWKIAIALGVGLICGAYLSRFLKAQLFNVSELDPVVYLAVSTLLVLVGFVASYLPARRAAKVDPIIALRCE